MSRRCISASSVELSPAAAAAGSAVERALGAGAVSPLAGADDATAGGLLAGSFPALAAVGAAGADGAGDGGADGIAALGAAEAGVAVGAAGAAAAC
ncbi:MAG: hypothetical protein ACHQF3_03990 [Alphaproteobacteria bacterium]